MLDSHMHHLYSTLLSSCLFHPSCLSSVFFHQTQFFPHVTHNSRLSVCITVFCHFCFLFVLPHLSQVYSAFLLPGKIALISFQVYVWHYIHVLHTPQFSKVASYKYLVLSIFGVICYGFHYIYEVDEGVDAMSPGWKQNWIIDVVLKLRSQGLTCKWYGMLCWRAFTVQGPRLKFPPLCVPCQYGCDAATFTTPSPPQPLHTHIHIHTHHELYNHTHTRSCLNPGKVWSVPSSILHLSTHYETSEKQFRCGSGKGYQVPGR